MRIAVVGAGVSGLVAAHRLQREHQVVLFEAEERLGGHANTVDVDETDRTTPVDTGFLVLNTRTYPNLIALLGELGVETAPSEMSFSVRSERRDFEYNARDLGTLYAQRRNLVRPGFHRMVLDILRFHREARTIYAQDADLPLGEWLAQHRYSRAFVDDHLIPMIRAVWSARRDRALSFPARFMVRFFDNHGFLQVANRSPWLTVRGGSRTYVDAIRARFQGSIRTGAPVRAIRRTPGGVLVEARGLAPERFDHVVVACHADQALRLLERPLDVERELLGAFSYQDNETVLHTDASVMPRRRRVWASWNVHLDDGPEVDKGACLTYWINSLQPLATTRQYFVTLNHSAAIDPAKVLRTFRYAHPIFGLGTEAAQARHHELIARDGLSYCGAYWRNGFHEDGVVSALRVCKALGAARAELAA